MIQEGQPSKVKQETYTLQARVAEDLLTEETYHQYGSETSITFSQDDHPPAIPRPGHAPLVLKAQIGGYDMDRVFMYGGSSLNIIFASTLRKMSIPRSVWKNLGLTISNVVPGEAASSLGSIELDVIFGSKGNFTRKILEFDVLNWESQYHAILGRPAFAQFMAVLHYAYLKLKMPGPSGVITVNGNFIKSDQFDRDFHQVFDTFGARQQLSEIAMVVDKSVFPLPSRSEKKEFTRSFSIGSEQLIRCT